ncbi:MAG: membrane protein insertion efficiency factor YidD [Planctomycetota bacterium]|nr:membrane protein insertion efficiency factor YidD [Planctomycetota bacterium]
MDENQGQHEYRAGILGSCLIGCVRVYQAVGSPIFGRHCRYHPTCSHYAVESIQVHGAFKGAWLAIRRIVRCHPFAGAGLDPVPPRHDRKAGQNS